jgi:hypothetical protein
MSASWAMKVGWVGRLWSTSVALVGTVSVSVSSRGSVVRPMRKESCVCAPEGRVIVRSRSELDEAGDGVLPLGDEAVVGDLEDRGLLVLVDRDDDLRALHAGEVLDRAGDGDGDVELGGDDLAGLADLQIGGDHAGVGGGAAGPEGASEEVGQLLEDLEVGALAHAAAAGHDDLGLGEGGSAALGLLHALDLDAAGVDRRVGEGLD